MKKIHILFLLTAMLLFVASCVKETAPEQLQSAVEFSVSIEKEAKTHISGNDIVWDASDEVAVFNGSTLKLRYGIKSISSSGTSAMLECRNPQSGSGSPLTSNYAYYPYLNVSSVEKSGSGVSFLVTIPSAQTYTPGSYDKQSFPMCAATIDKDHRAFGFFNICGIFKMQLKGENVTIKSIKFKGNNNEILAGNARVSCAHGQIPALSFISDTQEEITLDCGSGISLNPNTVSEFFISLPPVKLDKGISLTFITDSKTVTKTINKALEIKRATVAVMSPYVPVYDNTLGEGGDILTP